MPDETVETVIEPKERMYTEREHKGLLADKQNETKARQEAQAKAAQYEVRLAELEAKLEKAATKEEDTGDPDDVATVSMLNKKIDKLEKKLLDMYAKEKLDMTTSDKNKLIEKSFKKAQDKYTEEKAGKGLSWDEVNEGTKRMILKNKKYRELILDDPDPGETAYEIGLKDEVIAKRYETYKKTLPASTVTSKEGLEGTTVPGGFYSQAIVAKMSEKQISDHWSEIEASMKKWK